ncbi:hypothetical protein VE02_02609 [Pseudogymnoascus sp. 03VT05]|nr:hypothetical protein VE02_02609 [Pseudogymnoascus sp. 03VT05]
MSDDSNRELRRLKKKLRISFKRLPSTEALPIEHHETFNRIRSIRNKTLDDYCKDITFKNNEPWRKQTLDRVKWLACRATNLVNQQRNEAGWRSEIENDVFHRFRVEVACPTCRARIWKSEFEAYNDLPYADACKLSERRSRRKPCNCPLEQRRGDSYYDVGENLLFDNRAEELIMHGPLVEKIQLPKKKPDRVFGLKKTKAFAKILDVEGRDNDEDSRCSPFKDSIDPLLFPFLIIEAKPEKKSVGFDETQTQTAFPIWELLRLQESIRAEASRESQSACPLVWFFANRGDSWRLYGCYVTQTEPKRYEILQLWDGCITEEQDSLQLLLIIDYIADWARDIYRPSILKHLKSTVSKIAYDQVSLSNDSDIFSLTSAYHLTRKISNWIPPPPTIMDVDETLEGMVPDPGPILHRNFLPVSIPNTERGSLRSASLFESRIFGLRLTEQNVEHMLRFSEGIYREDEKSEKMARDILNLFSGSDCIAIPETDLDFLEDSWTGDRSAEARASTSSNSTTFYVFEEFSTFITNTWNIAKEISYLAVSKAALDELIAAADFKKPPSGLKSIALRARPCSHTVWRDAIECLRLGSPWQHFCAAITCTQLSISSLPARKRADYTPDTEALGFTRTSRTLRTPRTSQIPMRRIIERCHKYSRKQSSSKIPRELRSTWEVNPEPHQLSFIRDFERTQVTSLQQDHNIQICKRCRYFSNKPKEDHRFSLINAPPIPEYGMVLVATLDLTTAPPTKHDLCLIAFDISPEITDSTSALAVVVDDLLQKSEIFHTIRHPLPPRYANELSSCDTIWNLPLPYRPVTKKQRYDVQSWSLELQGRQPAVWVPNITGRQMDHWDNLQLLLHFMKHGSKWEHARAEVEDLVERSQRRSGFYWSKEYRRSIPN